MKFSKYLLLVTCLLFGINSLSYAADGLSGNEILDQLNEDSSIITSSGVTTVNLITENKKGQQTSNQLKIYVKDEEEVSKQLLEYLEPADVEGTKFLSINYEGKEESDMWLYLPALGKERRIAGNQTKDNFMGTDFTYEEIGGGGNYREEYDAERLTDQIIKGYECYQLELKPLNQDSEYSKVMMWVWQEEMMPIQVEFYDLDGRLYKKLDYNKLTEDEDGKYTAEEIIMANVIDKTRTIVEILEKQEQEIDDIYFSVRYLRR